MPRRPGHGALQVTLCTVLQLCFGTVYAWSFFQVLLVQQVDWSFTESAWAFSLAIFSLGIAAAWAGQMLPRLGPRKLALLGSVLFCSGYLIAGFALEADNLLLFCLGYGVVGGTGIGMGYVTPVSTAANWFPNNRGLATGIVVMGFGVGALMLSKGLAPLLVIRAEGDLARVFIWLGLTFAVVLLPTSLLLSNPPPASGATPRKEAPSQVPVKAHLRTSQFSLLWLVFFFNIAAGISIISFQSELLQEVWSLSDPSVEPAVLAEYGATLIAVSSVFNGIGRLFWGLLSDRIGRVRVFRILLATQMVVFGILMTETDPWIFSILVCYVLLCFGGGFATMPPFILDVFGSVRMSAMYGAVLTAWAAAGVTGPIYVGYLKDSYPDRAVMYCFLIGIFMLGAGYLFSYLLNDDRIRLERPTLEGTLREFGIPVPQIR